MAIIGNNDVVSTGIETAISWEHHINSTDSLVCPANQVITSFNYRSSTTTASATETVQLGIYDISSGVNNAPLIASETVTFDGTAAGVYSSTGLSIDLSAHSGKTLAIARAKSSTNSQRGYRAGTGEPESASSSTTLANPFVQNDLTGSRWYGIWAATEDAAPTYTITSIDGDNDVQAGKPNVDIVMTATTGVTSVTLGGEALTINGVT